MDGTSERGAGDKYQEHKFVRNCDGGPGQIVKPDAQLLDGGGGSTPTTHSPIDGDWAGGSEGCPTVLGGIYVSIRHGVYLLYAILIGHTVVTRCFGPLVVVDVQV